VTKLLTQKQIRAAAEIIKNGGVVAVRTETVFGLAAKLDCAEKLYIAKNRPENKHLIMQFPTIKAAKMYLKSGVSCAEMRLLRRYKRGLTVICMGENGQNPPQGVRIPADRVTKKLLKICGEPLYVTSANISGEPDATTWEQVQKSLDGKIDAIIMSKPCKIGLPSTIVKITDGEIEIIRQGAAHVCLKNTKLTLKDFVDMENIERQYFARTDIMPAKQSYEIYQADPNHICVVKRGGRCVGFVLALSLNQDTYRRVKQGEQDETEIRPSDLNLGNTKYSFIYLSSIAVHKKHRDTKTLSELFENFKTRMREIIGNGANIIEVMTEPITPQGKKIATRFLKMKPDGKNPKIYCIDGQTFLKIFR
jgi:tRNA threonylcarbamoyl adenosine modification protein (Sua5/YciO/YrdC/YwlC family)